MTCFFVLAMGCGKRKSSVPAETFRTANDICNGRIGSFKINLNRSRSENSLFEIRIDTLATTEQGQLVRVALANKELNYRELVPYAKLVANRTLYKGYVTQADLEQFRFAVVAVYDGGQTNFLDTRDERDAICALPRTDTTTNPNEPVELQQESRGLQLMGQEITA